MAVMLVAGLAVLVAVMVAAGLAGLVAVMAAEEAAEGASEEASEANEPSAPKKKRVLRRTGSSKPVQSGRATQRQEAQAQPMRQTRRVAVEAVEKAAAAKNTAAAASSSTKRVAASSSTKHAWTPSPSPAGTIPVDDYDLGSFSPRRKRRAEEEDE